MFLSAGQSNSSGKYRQYRTPLSVSEQRTWRVEQVMLGRPDYEHGRATGRALGPVEELWPIPELALGIVPEAMNNSRKIVVIPTHS